MDGLSKGKYQRLKIFCPCFFTTLNLLMGIIVIYFMTINRSNSSKTFLPLLIIFAGFCDWIDGKIARRLGADSQFGKELDSFADSISFGLAPVTLVVYQLVEYAGFIGTIAVILFPLAGIYRLARFNVSKSNGYYFEGLPIPVAGVGLAIKQIIVTSLDIGQNGVYIDSYMTSIVMILASLLMVSKIKVKKV